MRKIHLLFLGFLVLNACSSSKSLDHTILSNDDQLRAKKSSAPQVPYLKAHLKNGSVYAFGGSWNVDTARNVVEGVGKSYDYKRRLIGNGDLLVSIDSVALFETNQKLKPSEISGIGALIVLSGVNTAIGIYCLSNPKACFGSCPTFYIDPQSDIHNANAEGFSNAIAPSMAYSDIDDLSYTTANDSVFHLYMKNEALETHCVKSLQILALEKNENDVFQSVENKFYEVSEKLECTSAMGPEGDILPLVKESDLNERFSLADSVNLSSKEELIFTFDNPSENHGDLGLVLGFRQTLMTTYFIYSAMGYMGDKVGEYFAEIENNGEAINKLKNGLKQELGNVQVYIWEENEGVWKDQGGFYETGPIAVNQQLLKLKNATVFGSEIKIKLIVNKGLWRIDNICLAEIVSEVKPIEIETYAIWKNDINFTDNSEALKSNGSIISMPGDEFKLSYKLPDSKKSYALFLQSEGYYLEWMRESWLKDKDLLTLKQMLQNPRRYLKQQSSDFKIYERTMEDVFWGSRIDTKTFSYED